MKKHVLLIEQDEKEMEMFEKALNKMSVSCMSVHSIEHAIKLLNSYSPDFILIDFDPNAKCLEGLREIKKTKNGSDIPLIVCVNEIDEASNEKLLSAGVSICLKKPNMFSTVVKKLKEIMSGLTGNNNGNSNLFRTHFQQ